MNPTDVYFCPMTGCDWKHEAAPLDLPVDATDDDVADIGNRYTAEIEKAMTAHFTGDHVFADWVNEVSRLRASAAAAPPPLLCLGCFVDRHNAQRAGQPLPPQNLAQLIVNGTGQCPSHVKLQNGPVMPDRTGSGIILPGQMPPLNGG